MIKRSAKALWKNDTEKGSGELTTMSSVLKSVPYSFSSRFKDEEGRAGTNPEELLAASHAGCYAMALSLYLSKAGFKPQLIDTEATVLLDKIGDGFAIRKVELNVEAEVAGIDESRFDEFAQTAKANCLVSKALAIPIEMQARLRGKSASKEKTQAQEPAETVT